MTLTAPRRVKPTNTTPDLAEHVRARLRATRHQATVVNDPGLRPGRCRACDTNRAHPASLVVAVKLSTEWTEPITRLDGWSTPCCWYGLTAYLDEVEQVECFEGVTVEVPA